jgi:hypothetical protein
MSKWFIILIGNLIVNIPTTIIILIVSLLMMSFLDISFNLSIIFGVAVGWYVWSKLITVWVVYCLKRGVSKEEIFHLGKLGVINFNRHKIYDVEMIKDNKE